MKEKGLYRDSDCLCHGNLGNIELLMEVYIENEDINLYNKAIGRVKEIVTESKSEGYKNGIGQNFEN